MRLKKLKLQNFISYQKLDFDLTESYDEIPSIYIISGLNKDASESEDNSNGSGKSTLIGEAVSFNLFGRNLRGSFKKIKLENTIMFGAGKMINEIEYLIDQDNSILKIRREKERDGKSSLEIDVDGESKSKRLKRLSESDIRGFMGLDPDVYYQTISYYKDNLSLLSMNYGQRLDFFKKLVNLSIMDEYYKECKKYKDDVERKLYSLASKKKSQEDIISAIDSNSDKYQKIIQDAIDDLKKEIVEFEQLPIQEDSTFIEEISSLRTKEKESNTDSAKFSAIIKNTEAQIKDLTKSVKKFVEIKNTECLECGQLVSGDYADRIIEDKKKYLADLKNQNQTIEEKLEELISNKQKIGIKIAKLEQTIEKIRSENTVRKIKLESLYKQLQKKETELENVLNAINEKADTNVYLETIQKIDKVTKVLKRKQEINLFWYNNLAPKSLVRSAIIRKHVNILSDIFEYYLGKLFRNMIIGRMEIDDEGNIDILLKSGEFDVNYWSLSSGERKRVDIAMLFALFTYVYSSASNPPQFLILDEIADSLDNEGIQNACEVIIDIYKRFQIDIFIISHIPLQVDFFKKHGNVKEIMAIKENDISTAKYV